jgi:hypothetical protein
MIDGKDLMNRLNDGSIDKLAPQYVEEVRGKIVEACEELIEIGARIRPLYDGSEQIGWVRGIHLTERKLLQKWNPKPEDFTTQLLLLATSLPKDDIENLSSVELGRLIRLVDQMVSRDLSLFPYLNAYVTTVSSEYLWYGKGNSVTSFENKNINFDFGRKIKILVPSDHARLWASLCVYREQAKRRLDDNFNALSIIRSWVKNTGPMESALKRFSRSLTPNILDPWMNIIRVQKVELDDGWGHSMEDDTLEGLTREMKGIQDLDRHEQVMKAFEERQRKQAETEKRKLEELLRHQGEGMVDDVTQIRTDKEVRKIEADLRKGRREFVMKEPSEEQNADKRLEKYQK